MIRRVSGDLAQRLGRTTYTSATFESFQRNVETLEGRTIKTRTQKIIEDVLGDHSRATDNSLQAKAMRRALSGTTPRTLTPWEWEEWYAAQGKDISVESSGKQGN